MLKKISSLVGDFELQQPAMSPIYDDWAEVVDHSIFEHTTVLKVRSSILDVAVDSPTWAHQLLHQQQTILKKMQDRGYSKITSLSIRVTVRAKQEQAPPTRKPPLQRHRPVTSEMKKLFNECAAATSSPKLKKAFQKLGDLNQTE